MIINHEVPKCLLSSSPKYNNYDFCLPHLLDQDEEYLQYYKDAKAKGRYIIMDNSLHELKDVNKGHGYNHDRLHYWLNEIKPDEFIVPDVWENLTKTLINAKEWINFKYPKNTIPVAVVQAKSYKEAEYCYSGLKVYGYKKIAFSYGANYYKNISKHPNLYMAKALGRILVISKLYKSKIIKPLDRIHLLGCSLPQEFGWYKDMPFIESIDTSNPIMAAIDNIKYKPWGLDTKPKANMNTHFDISPMEFNVRLVYENVKMFKEINNIK